MSDFLKPLRQIFEKVEPIKPGIYHYQAPPDDPRNYRLHLRIENDGSGVLIVNAATILHLNQTAAEYVYYFIKNQPADEVAKEVAHRYRVDFDQAKSDYRDLVDRILTLIEVPDLDPITFLDFDRQIPYSGKISAPYRLDCALTYQLREGIDPEFAPTKRVTRELTTDEWLRIIDKAWQINIPHIIFTGGEPTLRDDLIQLITQAEANGQVTGLLTDGLRLADPEYLEAILQTGLDHLLIRLHSEAEIIWETLDKILAEDIYTAVHLTVTKDNASQLYDLLDQLSKIGIHALSLSADTEDLDPLLEEAQNRVASLDMSLIWDLPVPYSTHNPIALEVEENEPSNGAGRAWLYIEPDGDVLPAQGINKVVGNVLQDTFEDIWPVSM
ncbi:MAG: radical SAM protein [Anaerolineales bacterium]|jgi:organic radical activating enzyme